MDTDATARFDTKAFPRDARAAAWRDFTDAAALPIPEASGRFRAWQERWAGRSLHFRHTFCTGQLAKYRQTRLHDNSVVVCRLEGGASYVWAGSRKIQIQPGDVYLLDANATEAFMIRNATTMGVTIPYAAISIDRADQLEATVFRRGSVVSGMLSNALSAAFSGPVSLPDNDRRTLEDLLVSLVDTLILRREPDDRDRALLQPARRDAIRRYIETHLDDLTLDSPHLQAAFGVSRATIARDFAEEGGVTRYIARRRLEHALHELTNCMPRRGDIALIAERWGYADPGHFSRAFRQEFGFTPSDAASLH